MFGICNLSVVPCRKEPSDKSELVTQLLFGECFQLLDSQGNWQHIRTQYDEYDCWIDKKQFQPLSEKTFREIKEHETAITTDLLLLTSSENKHYEHIPIVLGSSLPKLKEDHFFMGKEKYSFEGSAIFSFAKKTSKNILPGITETAKWYLNSPYLWGGKSPFGIDCSGLTQIVYKINGIKLKRDAWQQAEQGKVLSFLEEAETGDLAFFDNEDGRITHVGIILTPLHSQKGALIIHASGKVRIDKLDHQGIYNEEMKKYTHRLRIVKKM